MATNAFVINQKASRVGELLEKRYGLRGQTLTDRLQRGRRKRAAATTSRKRSLTRPAKRPTTVPFGGLGSSAAA